LITTLLSSLLPHPSGSILERIHGVPRFEVYHLFVAIHFLLDLLQVFPWVSMRVRYIFTLPLIVMLNPLSTYSQGSHTCRRHLVMFLAGFPFVGLWLPFAVPQRGLDKERPFFSPPVLGGVDPSRRLWFTSSPSSCIFFFFVGNCRLRTTSRSLAPH